MSNRWRDDVNLKTDCTSRSLFTSHRERRLWRLALVVIVAIYSTLGLAGMLVEELSERNLLAATYTAGFVLAVAAIVGSAMRRRPGKREIWVTIGVVAAYLMVAVRMGVGPAERTHLFEFGVVAVLIHQALVERKLTRQVPMPAVLAVVVTALLGWLDEGIQAFLPNRVYDIRDVGVNALAGLLAISASLAIAWARQRSSAQ